MAVERQRNTSCSRNKFINAASEEKIRPSNLTPREAQILACVARALTNKEIAQELQISEKTIKHYMTVIMEKLQVRNRVEAVVKFTSMMKQHNQFGSQQQKWSGRAKEPNARACSSGPQMKSARKVARGQISSF
jgi:DNA-binding CsgD family transcriptional regulator